MTTVLTTSTYDPYNWYWLADDARLFSSSRATLIQPDDADYVAWTEAGNAPTPWPRDAAGEQTTEALQEVLTPYGLFIDLVAYAANVRFNHVSGGLTVTSISPVPFTSDPASRNALVNANEYAKATPGATVNWKFSDGSFMELDGAQLATATAAMATFVQDCFTCESNTDAAIEAGTITTQAEVDAAFAAIPNSVAGSVETRKRKQDQK